jgi:phosphatidate cytidylyltransferase
MNDWWSNSLHAGIAGLLGLLTVASFVVAGMVRTHPQRSYTELKLRVRTWWVILAVFIAAVAFEPIVGVVVFALVSFIAFKEFLTLVPTRRADYRVLLWAYLSIPVQYYWVANAWYGMFIIFIPVYVFLFLPMRMVMIGETNGFLRAAGTLHWGLMTTVFSLSHIAYLLVLPDRNESAVLVTGATLAFYLVVLTQLNDVAQYIWGKSLGKRKIVPKVSPGKTVEGFLGGVATTTMLAWVTAPWFTPLSPQEAILAGLIIGIGGFVGDVVVSAVKRDLGVKDSGTTLPGHGGILDRLDSLTFTAPLFFHFVYYLHY